MRANLCAPNVGVLALLRFTIVVSVTVIFIHFALKLELSKMIMVRVCVNVNRVLLLWVAHYRLERVRALLAPMGQLHQHAHQHALEIKVRVHKVLEVCNNKLLRAHGHSCYPPPLPVGSTGVLTSSSLVVSDDTTLADILRALGKIDKRTENFDALSSKLDSVHAELSNVTAKLAVLDQLPALVSRVDDVESAVAEQGVEIAEVKKAVTELSAKISSSEPLAGGATELLTKAVGPIVANVSMLAASVAKINAERARLSCELLISGLELTAITDAKRLAYAALHVVLPSLDLASIISARPFGPSRRLLGPESTADEPPNGVAGTAATAATPTSMVVTVSSSDLAHNLVVAKAKHGKLHTSALDSGLVSASGASVPLKASLINVNDFLPVDLYKLRRAVRDAARKKGFSTFVRDGEIFIRRTRDEAATRIPSMDALKNFLEGPP